VLARVVRGHFGLQPALEVSLMSHDEVDTRPTPIYRLDDAGLWDARDVASYLKASRSWVYHQAEAGQLPCLKIGGLQYTKHKKIAAAIRAGASRDLFYAKERRLAEIGLRLRPAFSATRLILPRQTRRLELAIARCVALAKTQQYSRDWR
jgi:hypothetical protein